MSVYFMKSDVYKQALGFGVNFDRFMTLLSSRPQKFSKIAIAGACRYGRISSPLASYGYPQFLA